MRDSFSEVSMEVPKYPSVPKIVQRGQGRAVRYFFALARRRRFPSISRRTVFDL